jgi:hypothetical protein
MIVSHRRLVRTVPTSALSSGRAKPFVHGKIGLNKWIIGRIALLRSGFTAAARGHLFKMHEVGQALFGPTLFFPQLFHYPTLTAFLRNATILLYAKVTGPCKI